MRINILNNGDEVLGINGNYIAIKRANGEVDLIPLIMDESGPRINEESIVTIGYGNNEVVAETTSGVTIINF